MNTAYTPIITYNTPPFGFAERPNLSDFPTCPEDPYSGTENIKERIKELSNDKNREYFKSVPEMNTNYIDNDNYKYHCIALYALFIIVLFFVIYYRPNISA